MRRPFRFSLGSVLLAAMLAGCSDELPQSSLNPAGPVAQDQKDLLILVIAIAAVVFVLAEGALLWFLFRYRRREGNEPEQIHGNSKLEIAWTIAPALVLAVIAVPTVSMIYDLDKPPTGKFIEVDAIGHQWWWEFRYPELGITTANVMVIPEDVDIAVRLCAAGDTNSGTPVGQPCTEPAPAIGDAVIHSFWVPRLAGKQDLIPGQPNNLRLLAAEPGTYPGQCAEYCGLSHAYMRFEVEAVTEADFQAWVTEQKAPATSAPPESFAQCAGCHAVAPDAVGIGGPDLTHLQSRSCFAGCWLDMNPENLAKWLRDPQSAKPGSFMPNLNLSDAEVDELVAYLETLE